MDLKLLKLQISSDILSKRGHPLIFEYISSIEILNILQFDFKNLFLQAKIVLKEDLKKNYHLIEEYETINFIYVLKERGNEIICLMSISTDTPILPRHLLPNIAIMPPIILDPTSLHFNFIIPETNLPRLYKFLEKYANSFEILAIENLTMDFSETPLLTPKFTKRQTEISRYAFRNGYFETPKHISAKEIALHYNVSTSMVTKHLRISMKKAMKFFFS